MRVAILSEYPERLAPAFEAEGDTWSVFGSIADIKDADYIVVYGHRHIIREPYLSRWNGKLINLHISFLPWNRGSDPNFWSWVDETPKGVSIHLIDKGLDTGPILIQREVELSGTLASSYWQLRRAIEALFAESWSLLRAGKLPPRPQTHSGSYHRSSEKLVLFEQLPLAFATPVYELQKLNRENNGVKKDVD